MEKQGPHVDPESPTYTAPDPARLPARFREAMSSPEMQLFRETLRLRPDASIREAVLDDLSTYYGLSPAECVERCINWESWSVKEWNARDRSSPEGIADFYATVQSWSFDLLWYAYVQAEGALYPVPVVAARELGSGLVGRRVLDFGSGVGTTAHFLEALGCQVDLADISTPLLEFARFRLERRNVVASYLNLTQTSLPESEYDVIFAIDTLVHVPDLKAVANQLHRALKPNGLLFANFDTRPPSPENSWHLYAKDLPMRYVVQRAGFEQRARFDGYLTRYEKVSSRGLGHSARGLRDRVLVNTPVREAYRSLRRRVAL
ncbi:MAG TPA: class I SAM-dependent methyltransferase [Candidatus Dormibacteraeota bacterium]|nr:class I SAM-dependent methyltransferase [Candidatus Dormibacteraeota bacterium]